MNSNLDKQSVIFTRYFLLDEIDARTAAQELAALPGFTLDGHYYWLQDDWESGKVEKKLAALRDELELLGFNPPAA